MKRETARSGKEGEDVGMRDACIYTGYSNKDKIRKQ